MDNLLNIMLEKQLPNINVKHKLQYADLKRICKYVESSPFNNIDECCIWKGYITNLTNKTKGVYVNFYFNGKKTALHRLLYINFIGELNDSEYLKFTCENKGKCCNLTHIKKFTSNKPDKKIKKKENKKNKEKKEIDFELNFD